MTETYDWIEEQLEEAWEEGMNIILWPITTF